MSLRAQRGNRMLGRAITQGTLRIIVLLAINHTTHRSNRSTMDYLQ